VQSLAGAKKLPEWLLFDFLTLTYTADKDRDNPHLRLPAPSAAPRQSRLLYPSLNSKAIPFKLDHIIPSDELTHDTKAVAMQMYGPKDFQIMYLPVIVNVDKQQLYMQDSGITANLQCYKRYGAVQTSFSLNKSELNNWTVQKITCCHSQPLDYIWK